MRARTPGYRTRGLEPTAQSRIAGNSTTSRIERAGQQHHQPVDADADAAGRRHALLERLHEQPRRRAAPPRRRASARAALRLEARALLVGVVELGERVGDLHAAGERLEALDQPRLARCVLGERRELDRVVDDERRLDERRLDVLREQVVDELRPGRPSVRISSPALGDRRRQRVARRAAARTSMPVRLGDRRRAA